MALTDNLELLITYENSNVEDQSGNGRDGSITGMSFETGSPLIGLVSGNYDGTDDFLTFVTGPPISFTADQPFTLAKWVKVSDRTVFQPVIARSNVAQVGYTLAIGGFTNEGEILVAFNTDASNRRIKRSSTLISNDTKHLIMATYDGSGSVDGFKLYIDNVDAGDGGTISSGTLTDPNYTGINLTMGARTGDSGTFSLNGIADVGAIWSYVLPPDERDEFYNDDDGWEGVSELQAIVSTPLGDRDSGSSKVFNDSLFSFVRRVIGDSNVLLSSVTSLNATGAAAYLQFFDVANPNDVTLGTTTPDFVIGIGAQKQIHRKFKKPVRFFNGLFVASTTTRDGSTGAIQEVTLTYND